jgi:uncharacterized protein (DUF2225 family)
MEIIKHGRTYEAPQVVVCPVCECEFTYVKKEVKENWVRVTAEDSDLTFTYIHCPECGKTIIINDFRK